MPGRLVRLLDRARALLTRPSDPPEPYEVELPMPDLAPEAIALTVEEGAVRVRAATFERRVALPRDADAARLRAALRNGVLTLRAPRRG